VQHSLDVSKLRLRQIVEIHESMLELAAARGVLDREPNNLQRPPSMIVPSKDVDARFLQGAEQTPFSERVVIVALTIVLAIPDRLIAHTPRRLPFGPRHDSGGADPARSSVRARRAKSNSS